CMGVTLVATVVAPRVEVPKGRPSSLRSAISGPFIEFFRSGQTRASILLVCFLLLYKLGDVLATSLATPFYIDLGFSLTEIGAIVKSVALVSLLVGGFVGGVVITRIGINRALWLFGLVQLSTIPGFALLAAAGPIPWLLRAVEIG